MVLISDFVFGLTIPFRAIALIISSRRLAFWSVLPIIIAVATYTVFWGTVLAPFREYTAHAIEGWLAGVLGKGSVAEIQWAVRGVISFLVHALFFLIMLFTFAWVSNFVGLPINDFVAEAAELSLTPPLVRPPSLGFMYEFSLVLIDLKKSFLSLLGFILCFSIAWIPIINVAALFLTWLLLTYQYVSYPQTRRGIGAWDGFKSLFGNFGASIGFGAAISIGFGIPVLSVLLPPIGLVGGVILFARMPVR